MAGATVRGFDPAAMERASAVLPALEVCSDAYTVAKDADALVIESTYLDEEAEMARQFSHLTARQGAELAIKAGVKKLILTHISRRYRAKDVLKEAQAIFPNTVVARDFDLFQIRREE